MSTCHVTRLSDTGIGGPRRGTGDLRYCINKANAEPGPDVIDFTVTGTINLTAAYRSWQSDIDIQGPGATITYCSARIGDYYRIFHDFRFSGVTIRMVQHLSVSSVENRGRRIYNDGHTWGGGIRHDADNPSGNVSGNAKVRASMK